MNISSLIKALLVFVGLSGCFSVLCGAWLAHQNNVLTIESQNMVATALQYQFIHTVALFTSLVWYLHQPNKWLLVSVGLFFIGILGFSGSLYIKSFFELNQLGKLAPFGGTLLAVAWLFLVVAAFKLKGERKL